MDESDPRVTDCTRCSALVSSRSRIVNGVGPTDAELLIVGEAPGAQEDRDGEPFVGRSGALLDEALTETGFDRSTIRITNCVRCRPPDNRNPDASELRNCSEWLDAEIAAVDPSVILPVGKVPASHILDRDVAVTAEAGSVEQITVHGSRRTVVICIHPAAVLYDRSQEQRLYESLSVAGRLLGVAAPSQNQTDLGEF